MEQKRTVWIVLAAGIFLLVVIGTALLLYAPEAKNNTTAMYQRDIGTVWMSPETAQSKSGGALIQYEEPKAKIEYSEFSEESVPVEGNIDVENVNDKAVISDIASPKEGKTSIADPVITENMTVISTGVTTIYGSPESTVIDLNTTRAYEEEPVSNVKAQNKVAEEKIRETNTTRKIVEEKTVYHEEPVVSKPRPRPAEEPKPVAVKKAEPAPSKPKTASSSKPAAAPVKKAVPATSPAPVKKASPVAKAEPVVEKGPDRFWVQAGSYSTKKNADEARELLEQKKIQCEVFTFTDEKQNLFYRVRVGPYTSRGEAEYWKKQIDQIELFSKNKSFVLSTK